MTHTTSRRVSLALLAASTLIGTASLYGCNSPPSTVKIGVAQPLTGNLSALGQDLLNGVNLAVEEINKEGLQIKGKTVRLEVVAVDDRADAKTGVEVAKQLVDAGVVAVIGHLNSGVSIAAAPIYAEKSIAQLAISTNPKFTELGLPTTFRLVANDRLQAKAIGSYSASQFPAMRYATVDDSTPYGKDLAEGAAAELKKAKKEVVLHESFDEKTVQFDAFAKKLKDEKIEALVSTVSDFQLLVLLEALSKIDSPASPCSGPIPSRPPTCSRAPTWSARCMSPRPFWSRVNLPQAPPFWTSTGPSTRPYRPTLVTTPTTPPTSWLRPSSARKMPSPKPLCRPCASSTATPP
jgi:branched-chain amino acid transport system substrate-binding protein